MSTPHVMAAEMDAKTLRFVMENYAATLAGFAADNLMATARAIADARRVSEHDCARIAEEAPRLRAALARLEQAAAIAQRARSAPKDSRNMQPNRNDDGATEKAAPQVRESQ